MRYFACPEVALGLIPGWGGTQLIPKLVGAELAVRFIVTNPLRQNRMLDGRKAHELGFADHLFEPAELVDASLEVLLGRSRRACRSGSPPSWRAPPTSSAWRGCSSTRSSTAPRPRPTAHST